MSRPIHAGSLVFEESISASTSSTSIQNFLKLIWFRIRSFSHWIISWVVIISVHEWSVSTHSTGSAEVSLSVSIMHLINLNIFLFVLSGHKLISSLVLIFIEPSWWSTLRHFSSRGETSIPSPRNICSGLRLKWAFFHLLLKSFLLCLNPILMSLEVFILLVPH